MKAQWLRDTGLALPAAALGIGLGSGLLGAAPAYAVSDGVQILTGGYYAGIASPAFTSPGFTTALPDSTPAPGKGEEAVQMRMAAGVLSRLKVHVTTDTAPSSGKMTVTVRINGANTKLKCSVSGSGNCQTNKKRKVTVKENDRLSLEITNNFVGTAAAAVSYTLQYD